MHAVEAITKLNDYFSLLPDAYGELLCIDNFETKIDPKIEKRNPNKHGFEIMDYKRN